MRYCLPMPTGKFGFFAFQGLSELQEAHAEGFRVPVVAPAGSEPWGWRSGRAGYLNDPQLGHPRVRALVPPLVPRPLQVQNDRESTGKAVEGTIVRKSPYSRVGISKGAEAGAKDGSRMIHRQGEGLGRMGGSCSQQAYGAY